MREGIRLQKFLSSAGVASRRHAEDLILQGAVTVNGQPAQIGDKVVPARDRVECNGKLVRAEERIYYLALNKPKGYICSRSDPQGRKSVYGLLPEELRSKVWSVGRLDFFTEGLLLFTNDGELTQALAHPRYEHEKEYEVVVNRLPGPDNTQLDRLRAGVDIGDGARTSPAELHMRDGKIYITIHEGRNRQIHRMFEAVGLKVTSLKRIRVNKLALGELPAGKYRFVQRADII